MQLYNAQGQPLSAQDLLQIQQAFSSGDENVPRVYDANGDALGTGAGNPARTAVMQSLSDLGITGNGGYGVGGMVDMGDGRQGLMLDAQKAAQAQAAGIPISYVNGLPVVDASLSGVHGAIGSNALFPDMPQTGFVQDILTNPAFLTAVTLGTAGSAGLLGGAPEAGAVTGGGVGGGAGGVSGLVSNPLTGIGDGAFDATGGAIDGGLAGGATGAGIWGNAITGANTAGLGTAGIGTAGAAGAGLLNESAGLDTSAPAGPDGRMPTVSNPTPGITPSTVAGGVTATSALTKLLSGGTMSDADWASLEMGAAGVAAPGILGYLGATKSADAYNDVANKYLTLGAPSRARYDASFAPGFDLLQADPGLKGALDAAADVKNRSLSIGGNPADNPGAQAELQKYLIGNVYLPQLNTYRSQNLTGGDEGVNTSGTASNAAAASQGGELSGVAYSLGNLLNPQPNMNDTLAKLGLSIGGMAYRG